MKVLTQHYRDSHWDFLKRLGNACDAAGGKAFLVGGCVRSALLNEAVEDFDVEVFGLEPANLERILGRLAPVTLVGKAFGIYKLSGWPVDVGLPRTERKTGSGHRDFVVDIRPGMSLHEAAMRRDFTVNALYLDIMEEQVIDPLGGIQDLRNKVLRHCSERFSEDPLRVLRAMQFAARIPATVHPSTCELCACLDPGTLSRERFFGEWEKLLLVGKTPSTGLAFLKECGWTRFFPELQVLIDCPQDPAWHPEGDVWIHTLHCLDAFAQTRSGDREEDLVVGFAVLCHDMGKPATTETSDGKIRSPGHETAGLRPAREFLARLNVPNHLIEQILPLVKCHMRPAALFNSRSSSSAIRRLARDCGRMDLLLRVFQSDAAGRPPMEDNSAEAADWLREQSRALNVEQSGPKPILRGRDLLQRGWNSGPAMGRFLAKAYEAQLDGAFSDHEQAIIWLNTQDPGMRSGTDTQSEIL